MVAGLLGNESSDSNRFTLVTPKSENDVRLQATLGNQNPTGLPVGVVSIERYLSEKTYHQIGDTLFSVPGMALIQSEIVRPQVVTAKCSEPQADTIKVGVKEVV